MKQVTFIYNGKEYKGSVEVSTEALPYFYWCFLEDEELVQELGDCITFKDDGAVIETTEMYPKKYDVLIEIIKKKVTALVKLAS